MDGAHLRAARLLLPRDRAQPARGRAVRGPRRDLRRRHRRRCRPNVPLMLSAHGSAPEVVEAARAHGRFVVNAVCPLVTKVHHEAKVRAGKGYTILYVGHAGHDEAVGTLAVAPESIRLVEHEEDVDEVLAEVSDPDQGRAPRPDHPGAARLAGHHRAGPGRVPRALDRDPQRPLLRHHQPPGGALRDRGPGRRGRGDRERQLVEHGRAGQGRARPPGARSCCGSTAPTSSTSTRSATPRSSGVTAGASAPEDLVEQVIEHLAPTDGVEIVNVTDEDEYFPPPRELRELLPRLVSLLAAHARRRAGCAAGAQLAPRRPLGRRLDRPRRPRPLDPPLVSARFGVALAAR